MNPEKIASWLLWPLAFPYGAAMRFRASLYRAGMLRQQRLDSVVISVGNLTVGGTGKTPMVLWLADRLASERKPVAILTRGYRGKKSAEGKTSDEARLLRAHLGDRAEVGVGADRFATGLELERRGARWFVLDDGFQHLHLARDADIVLVDATNPFGGRLLPAGRRREPRSALRRADVIVITRSSNASEVEAAIRRYSNAPMFYARPELRAIRRLNVDGLGSADQDIDYAAARERKLFAFCGIGNPAAFVADLQRWNLLIAGQRFFRDHHRYVQSDMDALVAEAQAAGADALVCTEKDAFNLSGVRCDAMEAFYCVISLCVDRTEGFWDTVMAIADKKKASRENRR